MSNRPLEGVRVLEFAEGIAGPYAGKLFADYGADVIKVEPAVGDRSRAMGPFPGEPHPEQSALFLHLNTNKRSVVTGDQDLLDRLLADTDVVIQSAADPDPAELRRRHPGVVIVSVTSFGLTGPNAGFAGEEIVHFAYGGPMSASGSEDGGPLKMGANIGQYQCGTVAAVSAMAGLARAANTGEGVHIDLSNVESQVGSIDRRMTYLLYAAYRGANVPRPGGYRVGVLPNGCRPTQDGHVHVSTMMNWLPRMLAAIDNPDLAELYADPDFVLSDTIAEIADAHLLGWTLSAGSQEAMANAQAASWPVTAVNQPVDVLTDQHFTARSFFSNVTHPEAGTFRQPGAPIRMEEGWRLGRPAPTLGQHTAEVTARAADRTEEAADRTAEAADRTADAAGNRTAETGGASSIDADGGPESASPDELPLAGLRVLDMTVVWAGPYTTCILGDLGAEIIRVDNPKVFPAATRGLMPRPPKEYIADAGGIAGGYPDAEPGERPWNRFALFNAHARNKRSITLDLRLEEGTEAFLRLVEQCDVMVENNAVDLIDKLGIGWETLHARNPRLILLRMPSVGLDGPYRTYLGFGANFEALCGLTAIRGYQGVDLSETDPVYHMDAASGSAGAFAALMALRRRERTGVGEMIELSQSENMLNHIGELLIDADRTGRVHEPLGNRHPRFAPQGCYRCSGDDAWAVISVTSDQAWLDLAEVAERPEWAADSRFETEVGRRANHDELDQLISDWTSSLTPREVFTRCQARGIASAPVLHELEAMADDHLLTRGMFRPNGNEEIGTHPYPTHLWHWDGPPLRWGPLPVMGGDNEAVLKGIAGLTDEEYADLEADGHISRDYLDPAGNPL